MVTKTEKAIRLYQSGEKKSALKLLKTFRLGFTKGEIRVLTIAYECLSGNEKFYKQLGLDTECYKLTADLIIKDKFKINLPKD